MMPATFYSGSCIIVATFYSGTCGGSSNRQYQHLSKFEKGASNFTVKVQLTQSVALSCFIGRNIGVHHTVALLLAMAKALPSCVHKTCKASYAESDLV